MSWPKGFGPGLLAVTRGGRQARRTGGSGAVGRENKEVSFKKWGKCISLIAVARRKKNSAAGLRGIPTGNVGGRGARKGRTVGGLSVSGT